MYLEPNLIFPVHWKLQATSLSYHVSKQKDMHGLYVNAKLRL